MKLAQTIESILFWKGEPVTLKQLVTMTNHSIEDVVKALEELGEQLKERGIILVNNDAEFELKTSPESSKLIESLTKEELSKDLGKASLETLAIVLYRGPANRREIEHIRGVNCQSILRSLETRGLIERVDESGRSPKYKGSMELLSMLGISSWNDMPEFETIQKELTKVVEVVITEQE